MLQADINAQFVSTQVGFGVKEVPFYDQLTGYKVCASMFTTSDGTHNIHIARLNKFATFDLCLYF